MLRQERLSWVSVIALAACNAPPDSPSATLTLNPTTTTDLVLSITPPQDPNGDEVEVVISWTRDGVAQPGLDGADRVPASNTAKGQLWEAALAGWDGKELSTPVTVSTQVINSAPVAQVQIDQTQPRVGEPLSATGSAEDDDGDVVELAYTWLVDGQKSGIEGPFVPAGRTVRGQVWEVRVRPSDGETDGETVSGGEVSVANSAPVLSQVQLSQTSGVGTNDVLSVTFEASDADGDRLEPTITWLVNGAGAGEGSELDGATAFAKGDTVEVVVSVSDGFVSSNEVRSDPIVVENSAPSLTSAAVSPDPIVTDDLLSCVPSGYDDADGDAESYLVAWTVDGAVVSTTSTLASTAFVKGDVVACVLTPDDGDDVGEAVASAPVTVQNSVPVVAAVTIDNGVPTVEDTVSVSFTSSDADDDPLTFTTTWMADGVAVGTGTSLDLTAVSKGAVLTVQVSAHDGSEASLPVTSAPVTVVNTPPTLSSVWLGPSGTVLTTTDLSAAFEASDADGDSLVATYAWTVNGSVATSTGDVLSASSFAKGDSVQVSVSVSDGTASDGPLSSSTILIQNSPPSGGSVLVDGALPSEDLICGLTEAAVDADGDALTYTIRWEKDGGTWTGAVGTTVDLGDTISSANTALGDVWGCRIDVTDGDDTIVLADDVLVADPVDVTFPSATSTAYNVSGTSTLGSSGSFLFYRIGSYVEEAYTETAIGRVKGLDLSFDMKDSTSAGCSDPEARFDVLVNGTVVGEYALDHNTGGRVAFSESFTFPYVAGEGVDGKDYTIRLEATNKVCSGKGTFSWYSGGDATLHP